MAQTTLAPDIRGVTIPLSGAQVLLPNACVSEMITYGDPQPVDEAPPWVMGITTWRGWRVPLFSLSMLTGQVEAENTSGAKVAVLKAFGGIHKMPYMAVLAQGFPRLTTITAENLLLDGDQDSLPEGMLYRVRVNDESSFIPDLNGIERHLLELMTPQRRHMEGSEQDEY